MNISKAVSVMKYCKVRTLQSINGKWYYAKQSCIKSQFAGEENVF